jgi:hypothetical protein
MLMLLRFPSRTVLYVRPEAIVALSEYRVRGVGVVHIANDAREAVWGDVEDLHTVMELVEAGSIHAQQSYNARVQRAIEEAEQAARLHEQNMQRQVVATIPNDKETVDDGHTPA